MDREDTPPAMSCGVYRLQVKCPSTSCIAVGAGALDKLIFVSSFLVPATYLDPR